MANFRYMGGMCASKPLWAVDLSTYDRNRTPVPGGICADADFYRMVTPLGEFLNLGNSVCTPSNTPVTLTTAILLAADDSNTATYYTGLLPALQTYADAYAVNTPLRIAHFLSQIGHESGFRVVEESGNYSEKRMRQVFGCKDGIKGYDAATDDCKIARIRGKLWDEEATYAHNSKNLLSYVYAGPKRMGNGDEASGDGYSYRGRGMIQLTGKANYAAFTKSHNAKNPGDVRDFVQTPDLLITDQRYGIESAFFFWDSRNINTAADGDDIAEVTERVNGGANGLPDRKARLARVKKALGL